MILDKFCLVMIYRLLARDVGVNHRKQMSPNARRAPGSQAGGPPAANAPRWSATSCSPTDSLRSTIGARGLNFRVRNGTGCASPAMVADQRGAFDCPGAALAVPWGPHSVASRRCPSKKGRNRTRIIGRARPISTARLNVSRRLHLRPINLVVYQGPYRRENSSWDWLPA